MITEGLFDDENHTVQIHEVSYLSTPLVVDVWCPSLDELLHVVNVEVVEVWQD